MRTQEQIASAAGISQAHLCGIFTGRKRPSWAVAKRLAATTGTDPADWMELPADELRRKLGLKPRRPYRRRENVSDA